MAKRKGPEDTSQLQTRLLRFALMGVMATSLIVGIISGFVLYSMIKQERDNALRFATESAASTLREYLTKTYSVAYQVTSRSFARRMLESYNKGAINQSLLAEVSAPEMQDAMNISPEIAGIATLGLNGERLVSVGVSVPSVAKRFTLADNRTPVIIGPSQIEGKWCLVVIAPVRSSQGERQGTVLIAFNVASVTDILTEPAGLGKAAEVYVIRNQPDKAEVLFWRKESTVEVGPGVMRKAIATALARANPTGTVLVPVRDTDAGSVFAITPIEGSDWSLVIRQSTAELYAQARLALAVAFAGIVIIILLTWLILLQFMRPLARRAIAQARELEREVKERTLAEEALRASESRLLVQTQDLARSNRDLEQFAYIASHDLQEPLRMISGYTQLLTRRYSERLDGEAAEFLDYVVDGAKRMQTLINDLLSYSRVGTRGKPLQEVDYQTVLERVLRDLGAAIQDHHATITYDALPIVWGDEGQLGQLLQNLIANSIKFHGTEPPRIHISPEHRPGYWLISVKDNGIGIESQYADRIFEIFQRLHSREEYPGTGIGLAVCRRIVERHGGKIWVESAPGQGSTFKFTLMERPES